MTIIRANNAYIELEAVQNNSIYNKVIIFAQHQQQ